MKAILTSILAVMAFISAQAYKFLYNFHDVPVSQAIVKIHKDHPELNINLIYDELNSYHTSANIRTDDAYEALRKTIGLNPVKIIKKKDSFYIEALQHGKFCYTGRAVGKANEPVAAATVMLLSPKDSTVITYGITDDAGRFSIPCDRQGIIVKLSCVGYKPKYKKVESFSLGTIRMEESPVQLQPVNVKGDNTFMFSDKTIYVPTKEQKKYAISGYDLLSNLMIPGLWVDRSTGSVTTPAGSPTLYIDGREADYRDVQSLRPKDVAKFEYYSIPSGKYAKDPCAINIILKEMNNGGYTQLDAMQGLGFLNGDYNLISKYAFGTKSLNLWAGYAIKNPKSSFEKNELFNFIVEQVDRENIYDNSDNKDFSEYLQASFSNRSDKFTWMIRGGVVYDRNSEAKADGTVNWSNNIADSNNKGFTSFSRRNRIVRPNAYFYGSHTLSKSSYLDYTLDCYYSNTHYNRQYSENGVSYNTNVKENYYYGKANANYSIALNHANNLSFILNEFMRVSVSDYSGLSAYNQNLYSSETILFADYSQRLGRFFYDVNPGLSYLSYGLTGMKTISHLTPRLQARAALMTGKSRQFQFALAFGNTYPRINTINNVEQQIDPIIILKGNPEMKNSILWSPRLGYSCNFSKIAVQTGLSYFYRNHAIVSDYYFRGGHMISSYRDDCVFHRPGADISFRYTPSDAVNMQVSGQWTDNIIRGGMENRNVTSLSASSRVNCYFGEFSIGAYVSTPVRDLVAGQIERKTFWRYQLSIMWNSNNWSVEANANNLFLSDNHIVDCLNTPVYSYSRTNWSRQYNQYFTVKVAYNFEYGKKTSKSPKYERKESESAILK